MKNLRALFLMAGVLSISTAAYAMPAAVPAKWSDNMAFRLDVLAGNPGFCIPHAAVWVCSSDY